MNKLNIKISKHKKDIIQKYTSGLFRDATLEFYGVKSAKIKELINVDLQVIEVADMSTDFVFLLEDNTYLHFEFQTTYNRNDLIRFANYDLLLYQRDKREIQTVVIYSSDVKTVAAELKVGSLVYAPDIVMMYDYDGNAIYAELEAKLKVGQELTDVDMLNLIFLPLMRNDIPKAELAEKSIELAKTIQDETKRNACIASTVAFMEKYLNAYEFNNILGVLKMTKIATLLIEDKVIEIAKKLLEQGLPLESISSATDLDIETLKSLQEQESVENAE